MSKRRTHGLEFKARVVMEAISGRKTIQEIAADHAAGLRNAAHFPM
jgi:transposase-like protein